MIRIKRGLDIPIAGAPEQIVGAGASVRRVAVLGPDFIGMKPKMEVAVGDKVKLGQTLFRDRKNHDIPYTSPAGGVVADIERGERRRLLSVVVEIGDEEDAVAFPRFEVAEVAELPAAEVRRVLLESGMWCSLRQRPFSCVPTPDAEVEYLFVNAMDSEPLSAKPSVIINNYRDEFTMGLVALSRLPKRELLLCHEIDFEAPTLPDIRAQVFAGPHPAGLSGTHMHFLAPVSLRRPAWSVSYSDVIAIGQLLGAGRAPSECVISLAGPQVQRPRLLRTRIGASVEELCDGELKEGENRIISGSVLSGRQATGSMAWLGRYHRQISVLLEGRGREFLGWLRPGRDRHSNLRVFARNLSPRQTPLPMTTSVNGSERAMVPTGNYERVMPLDILPTHLLRALLVGDTESAQELGCLELDEEDLALCAYVCSGKYEYAQLLRDNLSRIAEEG